MTITLKTNENNDIHAINGRLQFASGLGSVLQTAERVVKTLLKEMKYNQTRGIDYFNNVFSGSPNVLSFESRARAQITAIPDVVSVEAFEAVINDNQLSYTATIKTIYGTDQINGEL